MWFSAATAQAQYVVTDPGDCTGCGSLRDAIIAANAGAAVATIDVTGIAGSISLASPLPTITVPLSITGPGAPMGLNGGAQGAVVLSMTEDVTLVGVPIEDALTKSGTGTLILTDALGYSGDTAILAGAIRTDLDFILSPASSVSIAAGALLDLNSNSQEIDALSGEGDVSLADAILVTTYAGGTVTFAGTIAGTVNSGFVKLGAGTLVLSGTNTSNGYMDVEEGTLRLTGTNAVAASSIVVVNTGAILDLAGTSQTVQTLATGLATIALGSGTLTVDVPDPFTPAFVSGTITGTGNVVKIGPGDLLIFEPSTYTGNTTINDGILELFGDDFLPSSSTLTVNGGALFLDGLQTFAALSGSGGTVDLCACGALTINQPIDSLYAGAIVGAGTVTKAGAGTLTLTGANTYTGATMVSAGTLRITGSTSASSAVTVASGATLAGTGSVSGSIVVAAGGAITPGNSPGVLTTGAVTLAAGSSVLLKLNGATAGTQYDQLNVLGAVTLGGTLSVSLGFTPTIGQAFVILANDGVDAINGTFASLPQGGTVVVGSAPFRISYTGDTGNDVTLTYLGVTPTLTVSLSPDIFVGGILSATATFAGGAGAGGMITFRAYGPNDSTCAQPPVFTSVRAVAGNAVYQSEDFAPSAAGVYRWTASYSGDGQNLPVSSACNAASQTVTNKVTQTIAFGAIATTIYPSAPFTVSATASSGLAVSFSSQTTTVCTVTGNTVTLLALGLCTIAADQAGDTQYNAAPPVIQSFLVSANCAVLSLPAQLPAGQVAIPYSHTLTVTNGAAPVTITMIGSLPAGLAFVNGTLSGVPAQQGAFPITVTATDANSCQASASYSVAIAGERRLLTGAAERASTVRSFNIASGTVQSDVNAFGAFAGGTAVAQGDVDGNGVADAIVGAGPGGSPRVLVFDGSASAARLSFLAFPADYGGGVEVAAGDVNGDGVPEILAAAGCAGTPEVRAFDGRTSALIRRYFLTLPARSCRLHVSAGDVNGDGIADLVVGAGDPGASFVQVVDGVTGAVLRELDPFGTAFTGGVSVAVGDVTGDGFADIVTGAGPGGSPHVRIFDGLTGNQIEGALGSFHAYVPAFPGGVRVGAGDLNGDGRAEVITGAGAGGGPHVRVWDGASTTEIYGLYVFDPSFSGGVAVAGPPSGAGRMHVDLAERTGGTDIRIAGWAFREIATDTIGTDAVHAWAVPAGGGAPVFVGAAPERVPRPDVAAAFGGQFLMAGFDFGGTLAAGTYDLYVYVRNSRTLIFDQARVMRVTVP